VALLAGKGIISVSADDFGQTDNIFIIAASTLLVAYLLYLVFKRRNKESMEEFTDPASEINDKL